MARTRDEIEAIVELHTGKSDKETLMHGLCDNALKYAEQRHTFDDSVKLSKDISITEDATSVALPTEDVDSVALTTREVVTVRLIATDTDLNRWLFIKNRRWWDTHIVNQEDNLKAWPMFGMRVGADLILDRPCRASLTARFRVSKFLSFATGTTECPVTLLEIFVEHYVTAMVFLSLEDVEKYHFWMEIAVGTKGQQARNIVGGSLGVAIEADEREAANSDYLGQFPPGYRRGGITVTSGLSDIVDGINYGARGFNRPSRYYY